MAISYTAALDAPMLELEQERMLIQKWQTEKDRASLQTLLTSHARQIHACARKYNSRREIHEDLVAEGMVGLIHAADRFELSKNVRFSTYAHWWVLNSVRAASARLHSIVDIPNGARPDDATRSETSLRFSTDIESETGVELECEDPTPEEQAIAESEVIQIRKIISEAIQELGSVEQDIVISRNLQSDPDSLDILAKRHGLAREKLRQIERRAMARLKYALLSRGVTTAWAVH